jgi:HAD superfamily hydrolase (TIGR01509 family)
MIRGLIFDFDGLILETERPVYQSWLELYQAYGCYLSIEEWGQVIGRATYNFDPFETLQERAGRRLDGASLLPARRARELALVAEEPVMAGVVDCLQAAGRLGLKLGVASSSSSDWVVGHLKRLGLYEAFEAVVTGDQAQNAKPDPELYRLALQALKLRGTEAAALEDSYNGVLAAKRAGLYAVAAPNAMTRHMDFSLADLRVESLAEMGVAEMVARLERGAGGHSQDG